MKMHYFVAWIKQLSIINIRIYQTAFDFIKIELIYLMCTWHKYLKYPLNIYAIIYPLDLFFLLYVTLWFGYDLRKIIEFEIPYCGASIFVDTHIYKPFV